jgi:hypothetical protein
MIVRAILLTMSAEAPDSAAAAPEVTVRCGEHTAVSVRFFDRRREDRDSVHFVIEAHAPGLHARLEDVIAWIWDQDLARFLQQLADDFRGWRGERVWKTNDDDLALRAVFVSGGHVRLTWTLRPWRASSVGRWEATVTTELEAGEQMAALAADIRYFLHHDADA